MDPRETVAELTAKAHEISQQAGSKVAAAMKNVIGAAAGLTGFAVESARDLIQYMVRRGQMTQIEGDRLLREVEAAHGTRSPSPRHESRPAGSTRPAPPTAPRPSVEKKSAAEKKAPADKTARGAEKKPVAQKPPRNSRKEAPAADAAPAAEKAKPAASKRAAKGAAKKSAAKGSASKSTAPRPKAAAKSTPVKKKK